LNTRRFIIKLAKIEKKFVYIVEFIYHGVADVGCTLLMVSEEELPDKTLIDRVVGYAKNKSGWATTLSRSPENQQPNGKRSSTYRMHKLAHKEYMKTPEKYCERIINRSIGSITDEK
jgi:adenylate kinase family enzyme